MRKFTLLILAVMAGIGNVGAWNYLHGTFNSWTSSAASCLDNGPVAVYLEANETPYQFGIKAGDGNDSWKGPNGNASITGTTTISSFSSSGNFQLTVSETGYYVFSVTWENNNPTLTVRYPDTMVYFYNALGWSKVFLHDGWWGENDATGACNKNALRGVAMMAGENNIYSAYIPRASFYRITFTSDKQVNEGENDHGAGYDHFYSTSVVWNEAAFDVNTPIYVPTTTVSDTKNKCSYYYGGSWHAYPTYTREVTSGNFGTICLPFAATVTGATVYQIVSKVMEDGSLKGINLESVNALEAGKAYIFKATGSTLTATYTGSYADATEANGMLGNLSATAVTVPSGNYVVGSNQLHEVDGDGVTVGQYKAYITLKDITEAVAGARGSVFMAFDDEATGIEGVQAENAQGAIYNLQGQRVMDSHKGLVIINGKKMLNK